VDRDSGRPDSDRRDQRRCARTHRLGCAAVGEACTRFSAACARGRFGDGHGHRDAGDPAGFIGSAERPERNPNHTAAVDDHPADVERSEHPDLHAHLHADIYAHLHADSHTAPSGTDPGAKLGGTDPGLGRAGRRTIDPSGTLVERHSRAVQRVTGKTAVAPRAPTGH
jgi:hypothetical protein